jgi:hypothetical protein
MVNRHELAICKTAGPREEILPEGEKNPLPGSPIGNPRCPLPRP